MKKLGKRVVLSDYETAMGLWEKYNFEYGIILDEYNFYLRIKKELGIKPVNKLSKDELSTFPEIYFLNLHRPIDAKDHLNDLNPSQIKDLIWKINVDYVENALIHNLRTRISDYKRQISHSNVSRSKYGYDPDRCTSGNHTRQHKVLASSRF